MIYSLTFLSIFALSVSIYQAHIVIDISSSTFLAWRIEESGHHYIVILIISL